MKKNTQKTEKDIDLSFIEYANYQSRISVMGNTIDLLLRELVRSLGFSKKKYVPQMASNLERHSELLPQNPFVDYQKLSEDIKEFNKVWVIFKHSILVCGRGVFTLSKNNKLYEFTPERISLIEKRFTCIVGSLSKIVNDIKKERQRIVEMTA